MKTSRWKRRDRDTGLWIASSKPVFAYWFRFLKHAENDPSRNVDWSLYDEWGGKDYILHTKQNDWWKAKWKTLFGYKEGETEPLYPLSTSKPQPDGIRLSLINGKSQNGLRWLSIQNEETKEQKMHPLTQRIGSSILRGQLLREG